MSAAAGVGLFPIPEEGSNDNTGAAAAPPTGNPTVVVPSAGTGAGPNTGADANRRPPPALNILASLGAGASAPPTLGLTPEEQCAATDEDMMRCLTVKDRIAVLEKQASVVCTQCDRIRTQIATLRKEIGAPAQIADIRKQIAVAPAPVAPTAGELRYGRAPQPIVKANIDAACGIQLPTLETYATIGEGPVTSANYKGKIKPLVDTLSKSKDPGLKSLRDELKSYDPPGTFMSFFARRTAKNKAPLRNVAGRVSTALGCGVAAIEAKTAAQAQLNATRAAAAAEKARRQMEANAANTARIKAEIAANRAAEEAERKADPVWQASRERTAALRKALAAPSLNQQTTAKYLKDRAAEAAAKIAEKAAAEAAAKAAVEAKAREPEARELLTTPNNDLPLSAILKPGKVGGARRKAHRSRKARKTRRARKTAKK